MTVQIPLWTIVTNSGALPKTGYDSSDSSMDDCNVVNLNNHRRNFKVQIPLWTIVTLTGCVFRPDPDNHSGNIRTLFRNYPDSITGTSGHLVV